MYMYASKNGRRQDYAQTYLYTVLLETPAPTSIT